MLLFSTIESQRSEWWLSKRQLLIRKTTSCNSFQDFYDQNELKMIGAIDENGEWIWPKVKSQPGRRHYKKIFPKQSRVWPTGGTGVNTWSTAGSSSSGEFFANLFTSHTAATDQVGKFGRAKNLGDFSRYQTIGSFLSNLPWLISFQIPSTSFNFFASRCAFYFYMFNQQAN